MPKTCAHCNGSRKIQRAVSRTWWQRLLHYPETVEVPCDTCGGIGVVRGSKEEERQFELRRQIKQTQGIADPQLRAKHLLTVANRDNIDAVVRELAIIGKSAVPYLVETVVGPGAARDTAKRNVAITALGEIGDISAASALITCGAWNAVLKLGEAAVLSGDRNVVLRILAPVIDKASPDAKAKAAETLLTIVQPSEAQRVAAALERVRWGIIEVPVGGTADGSPSIVELLAKSLQVPGRNLRQRVAAALSSMGWTSATVNEKLAYAWAKPDLEFLTKHSVAAEKFLDDLSAGAGGYLFRSDARETKVELFGESELRQRELISRVLNISVPTTSDVAPIQQLGMIGTSRAVGPLFIVLCRESTDTPDVGSALITALQKILLRCGHEVSLESLEALARLDDPIKRIFRNFDYGPETNYLRTTSVVECARAELKRRDATAP